MKLNQQERRGHFAQLTAENKAALKRMHAQRWLDKNAPRLSETQRAAVRDAIAFFTPELYRNPADPKSRQREEQLKARLTCSLGQDRAMEAFTFFDPPKKRTWSDSIDAWFAWFADCVMW